MSTMATRAPDSGVSDSEPLVLLLAQSRGGCEVGDGQ